MMQKGKIKYMWGIKNQLSYSEVASAGMDAFRLWAEANKPPGESRYNFEDKHEPSPEIIPYIEYPKKEV